MSQQPELLGSFDGDSWVGENEISQSRRWTLPRLWWLNLLLFLCTGVSTTVFGYALVSSFAAGHPFGEGDLLYSFYLFRHGNPLVARGAIFSIPLLLILMAHEMGHYVVCVRRRVDATLPFFMPSPTLFGTLGAFIRIRTPIYTRRDLFDIGAAGPIAGFVTLLPFLLMGVWLSHPVVGSDRNALLVAMPLGLRVLELWHFGVASAGHVLLHPMAIAALAGMLLTALNLLPLGQLDGGHVVYAALGERWHKIISTSMVGALVVMGKFYFPWWGWALLMFFVGRRHPLVYDNKALDMPRRWLAIATFVIFVLCFSLVPTRI